MQIATVSLHNFRSIDAVTFNLSNYSLLIGANNSGKSNIIDALRIFYDKDLKYDKPRDFPKFETGDDESWIDIKFKLSEIECLNTSDEYVLDGRYLKVRKYLDSTKKGIYAYTSDCTISDIQFLPPKKVQEGKLGNIIYIPAVSRLEDHTKLSGPSALRDLINNILKNLVATSRSFRDLTDRFEEFSENLKIETTEDGKSLSGMEDDINRELEEWDATFKLDINPIDESNIVKNLITHKVRDPQLDEELNEEQFGQGLQRHLIYALIKTASKYEMMNTSIESSEFATSMNLILFEEPEAFLHPTQQSSLCRDLRALAETEGSQVIISSHSPIFVSHTTYDIPSIVRLRRNFAKTLVGQIDQENLQQIFEDNLEINEALRGSRYEASPEDLLEEMEAVKYFLWLDPDRCGMFFAEQVLLVEGPTEKALINYLLNSNRISSPKGGLFVLDCMGKFNIHRFMNILYPLNMSHSVLFDSDGEQEVHRIVNTLINNSRNTLTYKIEAFPNCLEDFLGIEVCRHKHRKPQHVMLQLSKRNIEPERIEALIELVSELIQT